MGNSENLDGASIDSASERSLIIICTMEPISQLVLLTAIAGAAIPIGVFWRRLNMFLLASIIALQNLPEGFNSFRELNDGGMKQNNREMVGGLNGSLEAAEVVTAFDSCRKTKFLASSATSVA